MAFFDEVKDFLDDNEDNILLMVSVAEFLLPLFTKMLKSFGLTPEDIDLESGQILETGWQKLASRGYTRERFLELLEREKQKHMDS